MKHTVEPHHVGRRTRAACLTALLVLSVMISGRTARPAVALTNPFVVLEVDHSVATPWNAALGEDVRLDASTETLKGGRRLVILGSGKLVKECPVNRSTCSDIVSEDTPTHIAYHAEIVLRGKLVGQPSNKKVVSWKNFPQSVNLSVQAPAATKVKDDPLSYTVLAGIPFKVNYSFPKGLSSSVSTVKIEKLPDQTVVEECKLRANQNEGAVKCSTRWLTLTDLKIDTTYQAVDEVGFDKKEQQFRTVTIIPDSWPVELDAAGKNGVSTAGVLDAAAGEDVQITAIINDKNAKQLTPYVEKLEVVSDDGTVVMSCHHARTCPATVSRSGAAQVEFKGQVLVKDGTGVPGELVDVGEGLTRVKWGSAPGETITVKPGLTTKDMVTPKTSLNGMHTLAISGAISHTFTGTDGKQRTQCEDYLYAETVDGVFDCSAPWPQPDGQNTFRVEDDTSLVLVLNTCQAYPCNLDNQLSPPSPRPDYNPQHTYTTTIDNGDIIGTTAFWASPLGFLDQNTHVQTGFSGGFTITISP
jgi:hypothetical protein